MMTYIFLILMAYFGPNAKNLGNIQLEIWHFKRPIEDIYLYTMNVTLMLGMEFLSSLFNGVLLAYFSNINVLKVMKSLQKDFWIVFAIAEGVFLMEVGINYSKVLEKKTSVLQICLLKSITCLFQLFTLLSIGSGYDETQKFDWINGKYAINGTGLN